MFSFIKKKNVEEYELHSPLKAECIDLSKVKDKMFADRLLGDGVALNPQSNEILSPCDAVVQMIAKSKHAIGLKIGNEIDLLIHVGLDTVKLNGEGFQVFVKEGDRVKKGQKLLNFDSSFIKENGIELTTPIIITNSAYYEIEKANVLTQISPKDIILRIRKR